MSTATSYESGLVIDWRSAIDSRDILFRVRLEADALWTLIKDSNAARRIYELLLGHFVESQPLGKESRRSPGGSGAGEKPLSDAPFFSRTLVHLDIRLFDEPRPSCLVFLNELGEIRP